MKKELTVVYGQAPEASTSFQTRELSRHLEPWFTVRHLMLPAKAGKFSRAFRNYIQPLLSRPSAELLLYGNDGLVDLRRWRGQRNLYWYDAPEDWSQTRPNNFKDSLRCNNVIVADQVFAVSAAQVRVAKVLRPGRETSVHYLPVGVDCAFFDPAKADREGARRKYGFAPNDIVVGYLGYLGRWNDRFAGEALLEAGRLITDANVKYLVVGSGPAMDDWKKQLHAAGLENRCVLAGFIPETELPSALAAMDICVDTLESGFHSEARSETKLKQYMAMGRACVATDIGENRIDLDGGSAGLLTPPKATDLAAAIMDLTGNLGLRKTLGVLARARAEKVYDWRILARSMVERLGLA